jgi:hypothetical protein
MLVFKTFFRLIQKFNMFKKNLPIIGNFPLYTSSAREQNIRRPSLLYPL